MPLLKGINQRWGWEKSIAIKQWHSSSLRERDVIICPFNNTV